MDNSRFGWVRRKLPHVAAAVVTLAAGFALGDRFGEAEIPPAAFHDMRVTLPEEYCRLVAPWSAEVEALARRLGSLEAAYLFVRDTIDFDPSRAAGLPADILREGRADVSARRRCWPASTGRSGFPPTAFGSSPDRCCSKAPPSSMLGSTWNTGRFACSRMRRISSESTTSCSFRTRPSWTPSSTANCTVQRPELARSRNSNCLRGRHHKPGSAGRAYDDPATEAC
jgi:hypothetical protein